jgi:hypothetical protein
LKAIGGETAMSGARGSLFAPHPQTAPNSDAVAAARLLAVIAGDSNLSKRF